MCIWLPQGFPDGEPVRFASACSKVAIPRFPCRRIRRSLKKDKRSTALWKEDTMHRENVEQDNQMLIKFWDQTFTLSEEQKAYIQNPKQDWMKLAPSEKLFLAAHSLGQRGIIVRLWLRDSVGFHHCRQRRMP